MIRIAVVGDIGSGKSYVAKSFGYPVFDADIEVEKLYLKSNICFNKLNKLLPKYITSFPIKKKQILQAITSNESNLKKIIKIVHPEVKKNMNKFLKKNKTKKFVVLDIPLFLENKINKKSDVLVFVDSDKKKILKKLKKRINFNINLYKMFKKIQFSVEFKRKKSNFIIKNNFNKSIKKSVRRVLQGLI